MSDDPPLKSPAFQWYPRDVLSSMRVMEMSLAEEGAYRRLIDLCWLSGHVPADPKRAARIIGKGCTAEIARAILPMFNPHPTDPEKLIHTRLEEEREKQQAHRDQRKNAANARWSKPEQSREITDVNAKRLNDATASIPHIRDACSSSATASSPAGIPEPPNPLGGIVNGFHLDSDEANPPKKQRKPKPAAEIVEAIYQAFPRKEGKAYGLLAIEKAIGLIVASMGMTYPEAGTWLLARVTTFAKTQEGRPGNYIKMPQGWFNEGRYNEDPSAWASWNASNGNGKHGPLDRQNGQIKIDNNVTAMRKML